MLKSQKHNCEPDSDSAVLFCCGHKVKEQFYQKPLELHNHPLTLCILSNQQTEACTVVHC